MDFGNTAAASLDDLVEDMVSTTKEAKWEELVREVLPLEAEDLKALALVGPSRSQSGVQHLRAFHHVIALKLATGERPVDICATLSVTPQTITKLSKDAMFQELVEGYRQKVVDKAVDHVELMSLVSAECLMAMHERLVDDDERVAVGFETLRRTSETLVDRIGLSPIRRSETLSRVSHDITSEAIERIKSLHAEDSTYEAEAIDASFTEAPKELPPDTEPAPSIASAFQPVAGHEAQGEQSGGQGVREEGPAEATEGGNSGT
jgi:hypothetical protein